jgi:hypothetical protein
MKLSAVIPFCSEINSINETVNSVLINSTLFSETEVILINDGLLKENEIRDCFKNNLNKFVKIVKIFFAIKFTFQHFIVIFTLQNHI